MKAQKEDRIRERYKIRAEDRLRAAREARERALKEAFANNGEQKLDTPEARLTCADIEDCVKELKDNKVTAPYVSRDALACAHKIGYKAGYEIGYAAGAKDTTIAGYEVDGLRYVAELLQRNHVRPEDLRDLCHNARAIYDLIREDQVAAAEKMMRLM